MQLIDRHTSSPRLAAISFERETACRNRAELNAEATCLESLVHHRESVDCSTSLELVQRIFGAGDRKFLPVIRNSRVIGLCAREQIGFIMGSRFGFALYSHQPIETVMVAAPLVIVSGTSVRTVLDRTFARKGEEFHEDVVLVDADHCLLGLIKVEALAHLQSRLVTEQLDELERQRADAHRRNLELFQANHAARQSQGLYLGLFGSHTIGVALLDADGGIHEHNERLTEILNLEPTDGKTTSLLSRVVEGERAAFLDVLAAHAHGTRKPGTNEFTFQIPGRGARLIRCSTGWIRETGQVCACLDDVTEQRAMEQSAVRQEKQTLLDTLVGGIAHELNNKLTPVQGFAELLAIEATGSTASHIDIITKSVGEAARIIRQLLELSKPAPQQVELVDLRTIVEETLVMLRFQFRETDCAVQSQLSEEPVWVMADAGQLKQVALNLMINALHAMEGRRQPLLKVAVFADRSHAELVVSDNGCGISSENLGRIFDPFFTTKGPAHGTGLGLSICYSLVRQHRGEMAVQSVPGEGTQFVVKLPKEVAPLFSQASDVSLPKEALITPGTRVLVVEDDLVVRRLVQEILRTEFKCSVEIASNGEEALALLANRSFALVLSDIRMPLMNGFDLYLKLKETQPEIARRFVFLTGHPGENALSAKIAQWNVPVVAKPFKMADLADTCRPFLQSSPPA